MTTLGTSRIYRELRETHHLNWQDTRAQLQARMDFNLNVSKPERPEVQEERREWEAEEQ